MSVIKGQDLIEAGYEPGPMIGEMLAKVAEYEARGILDPHYMMKLLKRDFQAPPPKLAMREEPVAFTEAIAPQGKVEELNVAAVRRQMTALLKTPIIQRGAVMPDACPAGVAPAVIPVGGAIAVENAIIPALNPRCSSLEPFA